MTDSDEPKEGEIIPPGGAQLPAKRGGGKKNSFNRPQTPEDKEAERKETDPFHQVVLLGRGWWDFPGFEPTNEHRKMVQMLKFSGYTDEDIAAGLHMSVETLLKHFAWELRNAKMLIMGDLATRAYTRARRGNDVMTIFLLKTRSDGAFSERAATAAAITDSLKDVDALTDDKKADVIAALVDLMNPKRAKPEKDPK